MYVGATIKLWGRGPKTLLTNIQDDEFLFGRNNGMFIMLKVKVRTKYKIRRKFSNEIGDVNDQFNEDLAVRPLGAITLSGEDSKLNITMIEKDIIKII